MNKIFLLLIIITIGSCKKKQNDPEPINTSQVTPVSQGTFSSNGSYTTSGTVKLYKQNGKQTLVFEDFKTSNGPDLRVYLSTSTGNSDFKDLGALKSNSGSFNYDVDSSINTSTYKFVLIWCEDFSVLFGNAQLN
jgi:hypothetical protein